MPRNVRRGNSELRLGDLLMPAPGRLLKPLVHFVDGALPARTFAPLLEGIESLGRERIVAGYQTTFWFQLGSKPRSVVERAVPLLAKNLPASVRKRVKGVEWWLSRTRTSNVKVDFHRDRDNARWDQAREERNPLFSSLIYLNRCNGGLLAVTREPPNPKNQAFAPDRHDFDFVEPAPNRFAWFSGKLTHGVLDAKNQIPGARLPTEKSWRLAVAINWWAEAPWDVGSFADSRHYRRLLIP